MKKEKHKDIRRPEKAGNRMARAIIEMIHLMYQNRTAIKFLSSLIMTLQGEYIRRTSPLGDKTLKVVGLKKK